MKFGDDGFFCSITLINEFLQCLLLFVPRVNLGRTHLKIRKCLGFTKCFIIIEMLTVMYVNSSSSIKWNKNFLFSFPLISSQQVDDFLENFMNKLFFLVISCSFNEYAIHLFGLLNYY